MKQQKEFPIFTRQVTMFEYYSKEGNSVYRNWKIENGEWNKDLTPYNELPYTVIKQVLEKEEV